MEKLLFLLFAIYTSVASAAPTVSDVVRCQRPIILDMSLGTSRFLNGDASAYNPGHSLVTNALEIALSRSWKIVTPVTGYGQGGNGSSGFLVFIIVEKPFASESDCSLSRPIG